MGIYVFNMDVLSAELNRDNSDAQSTGGCSATGSLSGFLANPYLSWSAPSGSCVVSGPSGSRGTIDNSMLGSGSLVSGGSVVNSILSARVRIDDQAQVDSCILFDNVCVGAGSKLRRCIVDKDVQIPPGTHIGFDQQADTKNFHVSPNGIIAVPKL